MRKSIILAACLAVGFVASAQKEVVKDVEHMLKGGNPDYSAALNAIKPALSDPTTSGQQEAWYFAGKAGNGVYDQVFLKESIGQNPSASEKKAGGQALISTVDYYKKALTLPDEKGKQPGKRNKEILKVLSSLYPQLRNAGIFLLQAGDYDGAYDAWEIYCNLPSDPVFEGKGPKADPDSIIGQIEFYQAVAALSNNSNEKALKKLQDVIPTGYKSIDIYRYGIEAANRLGYDYKNTLYDFAQKGYEIYGTDDILFIGQLINARLEANDYPGARTLVDKALAQTPDTMPAVKAQLYDIMGNVVEKEGDDKAALDNFKKAVAVSPEYAKGYFDMGRIIYNNAIKEDENAEGKTQQGDVKTELLEAADLFKKAYQMDDSLSQIPNILYRLYYRLGAGYEDQAEEWKNM